MTDSCLASGINLPYNGAAMYWNVSSAGIERDGVDRLAFCSGAPMDFRGVSEFVYRFGIAMGW